MSLCSRPRIWICTTSRTGRKSIVHCEIGILRLVLAIDACTRPCRFASVGVCLCCQVSLASASGSNMLDEDGRGKDVCESRSEGLVMTQWFRWPVFVPAIVWAANIEMRRRSIIVHRTSTSQVRVGQTEGAWLHSGYLSRQVSSSCRNIFLHGPPIARSTPPKCSCSCRMILVVVERLAGSYFVEKRPCRRCA